MKSFAEIKAATGMMVIRHSDDGGIGYILGLDKRRSNKYAMVVWSTGCGWDHVSVSFEHRCPTWDDMCKVKDIFFDKEDMVVQYHPPKSMYVNFHPYCLHLWRIQNGEMPCPPTWMVGPRKGQTIDEVLKECVHAEQSGGN